MLIVFSGLPGVGKTTLARRLAVIRSATYVRIDIIEQAIRSADPLKREIGPIGYEIALALAESNLGLGRTVVADCVNPVAASRAAWGEVASRSQHRLYNIEVTCSDLQEHQRRVETRQPDIAGHQLPTWRSVMSHEFEPWLTERLVIDTANLPCEAAVAKIECHLCGG